jgi:carbon storage regulator CsrA
MLILSRKSMPQIQIGYSVVVTVLGLRDNKLQIGIEVPKEMHVLRIELQDHVPKAHRSAF